MKRRDPSAATAERRRGRIVGPLIAAGVLVGGIAITLLAVNALRLTQQDNAERVMDQRTAVALAAVTAETARYPALLEAIAAGFGTDPDLMPTDFIAGTAPLVNANLVGATSVVFVVPVAPDEVAGTQAFWRERGSSRLELKPHPGAEEHLFTVLGRTLGFNGPTVPGLDVAASPEAAAALREVRETRRPAVSDTYILLRDRGLPPAEQQLSFVFVAPVHSPEDGFRGWVLMGMRGQDFLGGVLDTASQGELDATLLATNADGTKVPVAGYSAGRGTADLHREETFWVADRQWILRTGADSRHLPGARTSLPTAVLAGGIAVTVMLAWLVLVLATGRARARNQVLDATADLRTAEEESRRQAGLLRAIMTSLGDGVGVVDADGNFLLHNPAARALLGVDEDVGLHGDWQQHYGLYLPDGRTPFPLEEMPLFRALRGESSDGVEMVVRNANRPDGILLSVDGRPLDPSGGQHGAVAVFHDITDLRRYETDLAVFAGVVAHDLKAPLAIVRGHCETALDELADAPVSRPVTEARAAMGRVTQTVDRMAGLIDTLLAYATARDAPLRPQLVDLEELVADVVATRIGHLRPGAGAAPEIYVGPLPEVRADPAMLRHVLDNLIGNALKYVQAGRVARIDVTALPADEDGWIRIEIADRGIGIPDEDKPDIFESFHRARTAAGYAGTGLGLAICRRIVERHGGAIGVADNPGGGTRFHFTLPLAVSAAIALPAGPSSGPAVDPPADPRPVDPPADLLPVGPEPAALPQTSFPAADPHAAARPHADRPAAQVRSGADPGAEDRAALSRLLAERAAAERSVLPGMLALPAASPSARRPGAPRVQDPVPDHLPGA